jgi:hypothetical protein
MAPKTKYQLFIVFIQIPIVSQITQRIMRGHQIETEMDQSTIAATEMDQSTIALFP